MPMWRIVRSFSHWRQAAYTLGRHAQAIRRRMRPSPRRANLARYQNLIRANFASKQQCANQQATVSADQAAIEADRAAVDAATA